MSLVDGNDLSTWEGGLFDRDNEDSVSLLFRLLWIFTQARAEGVNISLNEAGRPFGVFSDIDVGRAGQSAGSTFSGRSTVCYQYGRYLLWLATGGAQGTPSAANPYAGVYASQHTRGRAADIDCNNYGRLDQLAARVGMKRTISSEIWHYEIYRNPDGDIDFSPFSAVVNAVFGGANTPAGGAGTPLTPEEEFLLTQEFETLFARVSEAIARLDNDIIPRTKSIADQLAPLQNDESEGKRASQNEARGRLYFDAGPDGKTPQTKATRAVVQRITDGYIYPLNPDPVARQGQIASIQTTHYLIVGPQEYFEGLPTPQFDNLIEMANSHIRRIAFEVVRQLSLTPEQLAAEVKSWPVVGATVREGTFPARGLAGYEPQITVADGDHAA